MIVFGAHPRITRVGPSVERGHAGVARGRDGIRDAVETWLGDFGPSLTVSDAASVK